MRRVRWPLSLCCLLIVPAAQPGLAQDAIETAVPVDVVDVLLDVGGRSELVFMPDTMADSMRGALAWPRGPRVVGSLVSRSSTKVLLESSGSPESLVAFFRQALPPRGWRHQPQPGRSKFHTTMSDNYCHEHGSSVIVELRRREDAILAAITHRRSGYECRERRQVERLTLLPLLPDVLLPPDIRLKGSGRSRGDAAGIGGVEAATAVLETRLPLTSVLERLGAPLAATEWVLMGQWSGGQSAGQMWGWQLDDGRRLMTWLVLLKLDGDLIEASLQIARVLE